jgi:anti-sigma B factor antagonist
MTIPLPDRFHPTDAAYACELRRRDRVSEITLSGELDLAARSRLDTALRAALDFGATDSLVVDLTAVTFADSSTLHWLTEVKRQADAAGARLAVAIAQGAVRELLTIAGMEPHHLSS